MATLAALDDTTRPALEALLPQAWEQIWDPEFTRAVFRWRYRERPAGGETWLAMDGSQCVAVIDSFVRRYLLDGHRIAVRESCDWFCLPKYRPLGLGLKLMRKLMACSEPVLSIGGSAATIAILPRLGWKPLPSIDRFVLPVSARGLAGNLLRAQGPRREAYAKAIPASLHLRPPRQVSPPDGAANIEAWRPGMPTPLPLAARYGLVEILDDADLNWIMAMPPGVARPMALVFRIAGEQVGFSLSQLEPAASGLDGRIVHLQIMREGDQPVADWIVAETAQHLARTGAGFIRCRASNPEKIKALRRTGFLSIGPVLGYWWAKDPAPPGLVDFGYLRADDAVPFPALRGLRRGSGSRVAPGPSAPASMDRR